ncbi:protein 3a [Babaco ilarvirus 1]|nr:protein 3a [Babaco ilarvirus 1]
MTTLGEINTSDFEIVETSMEELQQVTKDLHDILLSKEMNNLPTKGCNVLHLVNLPKSNVLSLESKEQRSFITKQSDKLKKKIYRDVGRLFFVYVPFIQKSSGGYVTIKLQNSDTGEVSDVLTDGPANEAWAEMDRWGRSLVDGAKLNVLYSVYCPDIKPQARVGDMTVFWDECMSRHQIYSERGNPVMFPIEETKPSRYLKDKKLLMSMVRSRIASGVDGTDIGPELLQVTRLGEDRKMLTIKPREVKSPRDIRVEKVKEEHLTEQPISAAKERPKVEGSISG